MVIYLKPHVTRHPAVVELHFACLENVFSHLYFNDCMEWIFYCISETPARACLLWSSFSAKIQRILLFFSDLSLALRALTLLFAYYLICSFGFCFLLIITDHSLLWNSDILLLSLDLSSTCTCSLAFITVCIIMSYLLFYIYTFCSVISLTCIS